MLSHCEFGFSYGTLSVYGTVVLESYCPKDRSLGPNLGAQCLVDCCLCPNTGSILSNGPAFGS